MIFGDGALAREGGQHRRAQPLGQAHERGAGPCCCHASTRIDEREPGASQERGGCGHLPRIGRGPLHSRRRRDLHLARGSQHVNRYLQVRGARPSRAQGDHGPVHRPGDLRHAAARSFQAVTPAKSPSWSLTSWKTS